MAKYLLIVFLFFGFEKIWAAELPGEGFAEEDFRVPDRFITPAVQKLREKTTRYHTQACVDVTKECELLYPFAPPQQIFLWYLSAPRRVILPLSSPEIITSFIPSLTEIPAERLSEIAIVLRSLPPFFTTAAFNQINEGYLEGEATREQKWKNAAIVCEAIEKTTALIPGEKIELTSRLALFMQRRSLDVLPYYVEALQRRPAYIDIENNYYPFYCLSRRLKGDGESQDRLLRQLMHYGQITTGPGATLLLAIKLYNKINTLTRADAVVFISRIIEPDPPLAELLPLPQYSSKALCFEG